MAQTNFHFSLNGYEVLCNATHLGDAEQVELTLQCDYFVWRRDALTATARRTLRSCGGMLSAQFPSAEPFFALIAADGGAVLVRDAFNASPFGAGSSLTLLPLNPEDSRVWELPNVRIGAPEALTPGLNGGVRLDFELEPDADGVYLRSRARSTAEQQAARERYTAYLAATQNAQTAARQPVASCDVGALSRALTAALAEHLQLAYERQLGCNEFPPGSGNVAALFLTGGAAPGADGLRRFDFVLTGRWNWSERETWDNILAQAARFLNNRPQLVPAQIGEQLPAIYRIVTGEIDFARQIDADGARRRAARLYFAVQTG